jgi:hypothetical protein
MANLERAALLLGPAILYLQNQTDVRQVADLDLVEFFSGVMSIAGGCRYLGLMTAAYDSALHPDMDFMSAAGLLLAVQLIRRCKPGAILWLGPPCSSWVFMSRGSTGRRVDSPMGTSQGAAQANCLVARMCALLYFAHSQGIAFIVEQPSSSLMNRHPTFARLLELLSAQTCFLHMGAYGAMSLKPTVLGGTTPLLERMRRTQSRAEQRATRLMQNLPVSTYSIDENGRRRVTGGPGLRQTQAILLVMGWGVWYAFACADNQKHV